MHPRGHLAQLLPLFFLFACGAPPEILPGCGNGILDPGEVCDDGNLASGDGCRSDCLKEEACGDGEIDGGEACDDGNNVDGDGCRPDCSLPFCGDGILDNGEECDDGNFDNTDACTTSCIPSTCDNGAADEGEICFLPQASFPVGTLPFALISADFNGDSLADIATANVADQSVSILRNNGAGGFLPAASFNAGALPFGLVAGDFDNDLDLDIATANNALDAQGNVIASSVSILLNNGAGQFTLGGVFPLEGFFVLGLDAADFDGDGALDLATANLASSSVSMLFNDGAGSLEEVLIPIDPQFFLFPSQPASVAAGDIDNDGDPDLVVADATSPNGGILLNDGAGTLTFQSTLPLGFGQFVAALGDVDGDGDLDSAIVNAGQRNVSLLKNPGDGLFDSASQGSIDQPFGVALGDLTGDGLLDVVVTNSGILNENPREVIHIFVQTPEGVLDARGGFRVGLGPQNVVIEDFNGDGLFDVATVNFASNDVSVLFATF